MLSIHDCGLLTSGFNQLCFWAPVRSPVAAKETSGLNPVHSESIPTFTEIQMNNRYIKGPFLKNNNNNNNFVLGFFLFLLFLDP